IDSAREVLAINNRIVDREVERLRESADDVQRGLIVLVLFSTAVALAAALALSRYIARPIGEIDTAIRQLGGADFSRPIAVRGPEDLRYLGRRLDWLRRRLSEFETQTHRFLRHVSHELKTPLTALREGAGCLHDEVGGPLTAPQRQVVGIMRDNSLKLQRLIEELLDYQRALHAAASLEFKTVVLDELVADAARAHHLAAASKGLRLVLDAESATLDADPDKLRSIIDNLISNAVKFTPPGGTITVKARAAGGGEAVVEVMDSGPGVPAEERETIFNLFFRGRAKADSSGKGSGLGLAVARELGDARGWRRRGRARGDGLGPGRAGRGARDPVQPVLPRPAKRRQPREGLGPRHRDRARARGSARRAHLRGRRGGRRALPRDAAAPIGP